MARHKMEFGTCRLCGKETDLSFEHVPPRVAFNRKTTYLSVEFDDFIKVDNPLEEKYKGKKKRTNAVIIQIHYPHQKRKG